MLVLAEKESVYRLSLKNLKTGKNRRISAVIVTFNNSMMLKELLSDLFSQTCPPDQIIVVDNASDDNTPQIVRNSFPSVKYIRLCENTGSAGGYYEGIKAALENSDLIWTLDDDVRLRNDSLQEVLKGFEKLDFTLSVSSVRSVGDDHPYTSPTRLELFPWRGTLIKSELIRKYGLPMKEFFIYGEDLEYAMRFNERGFFCYWIPTSKCVEKRLEGKGQYEVMGKSVKIYASAFQLYYAFRNQLYIFMKYKDYWRMVRILLYSIKATMCIVLFDKIKGFNKIRAIGTGLVDGFRGNLGKHTKYLPGK
jgi:rhamnopyranosyl-N-acetylglucosaminyl-diphospho-decaprenol beta-1,3/1,4-galactofuranosyltransferase